MKRLFLCLALVGMIAAGCGETDEVIDPGKTEQPDDGKEDEENKDDGKEDEENKEEEPLPDLNKAIDFADPIVKYICVTNWDTNNDGELSYAEAAAVTDIGTVFRAEHIDIFDVV